MHEPFTMCKTILPYFLWSYFFFSVTDQVSVCVIHPMSSVFFIAQFCKAELFLGAYILHWRMTDFM